MFNLASCAIANRLGHYGLIYHARTSINIRSKKRLLSKLPTRTRRLSGSALVQLNGQPAKQEAELGEAPILIVAPRFSLSFLLSSYTLPSNV